MIGYRYHLRIYDGMKTQAYPIEVVMVDKAMGLRNFLLAAVLILWVSVEEEDIQWFSPEKNFTRFKMVL